MRKLVPLSPRLDRELESYVAVARAESRQMLITAAVIGTIGLASLSARWRLADTREQCSSAETGDIGCVGDGRCAA